MNFVPKINRRAFVVGSAAAGGLALGMDLPLGPRAASANTTPELGIWVVVKPDDTVVIRIARSEMGQGSLTGLCQLVAEELECDWSKVTTEYPTPGESLKRKRVWGAMNATGSRSIRELNEYVRQGGASARMMLLQAAANEWKVPVEQCKAENSVITGPDGKRTTFGKVADAASKLPVPEKPKLKDPKDWKVIGKPVKRLDTLDKLTGKQAYSIDVKMPNMLNAAIKDCPVFGGKVKSFDAAKVSGMKGVKKVMKVGEGAVAVVADTWWRAKTALEALPVEWDNGPNASVSSASLAKWLEEGLTADTGLVGTKTGDIDAALSAAAKKVEAVYAYPFQNHVCMEPMSATAVWTQNKCEVWTSTQNGEAALAAAIEASGLPGDKCDVHKMLLGGGFGRRARSEYVSEAVLIAKEFPGTPIKLTKTREEDMTNGVYHPITQCKLIAALDKDNNLTGLGFGSPASRSCRRCGRKPCSRGAIPIVFQGLFPGGAEGAIGYTVPNMLIDHSMRNPHVPPWFWRGVNNNQNAIYLECFMDELAHSRRAGFARIPAQADEQAPQASRRAQRRGRAHRLGQARAAGHVPRARAADGLRQLRRCRGRDLGHRRQQGEDPPHRRGDRLRPRGQSRADRAADRRFVRLRPVGGLPRRHHHQGWRRGGEELRHLRFDAHRPDAEG